MSNQPALPLAQPGQQPSPRVAPHNLEAEQALLGAILFDNETMNRITTQLKEPHFYDPVHGRIFATCTDMIAAGQLADGVTLKEKFAKDGGIKEIGGALYLMKLLENAAPLSTHAQSYAELIYDLARCLRVARCRRAARWGRGIRPSRQVALQRSRSRR
mgnify:CR=1 FL=1